MTTIFSSEEVKVGASFDLILDTEFLGLSAATERRIYFRKPGEAAEFKEAVLVEFTKFQASFTPSDTSKRMNLRTWTYARGTGTIVFKGKTFVVPVVEEDE